MQELNRQMMALPELRELEEIIRFGTGPAAVSGVSGVHRAMLGAALRQAAAAGVQVAAYSCRVTLDSMTIHRPVPVIL